MIDYDNKDFRSFCRLSGSTFPKACAFSMSSALLAMVLWALHYQEDSSFRHVVDHIAFEPSYYLSLSSLVGFLVVFRTSIAYSRFWDAARLSRDMMSHWFDCISSLVAFCANATAPPEEVEQFKGVQLRLFSLLHACAVVDLQRGRSKTQDESLTATLGALQVLDLKMDDVSREALRQSECKVDLVHGWIQTHIVKAMPTGVLNVPPPILSRAFQELASGVSKFDAAATISEVKFPFPYAQTSALLLFVHWVMTPVVMCRYASSMSLAGFFSFSVVGILFSLHLTAAQIEDPFGTDPNDLEPATLQRIMNQRLISLASGEMSRVPEMQMAVGVVTDGLGKRICTCPSALMLRLGSVGESLSSGSLSTACSRQEEVEAAATPASSVCHTVVSVCESEAEVDEGERLGPVLLGDDRSVTTSGGGGRGEGAGRPRLKASRPPAAADVAAEARQRAAMEGNWSPPRPAPPSRSFWRRSWEEPEMIVDEEDHSLRVPALVPVEVEGYRLGSRGILFSEVV